MNETKELKYNEKYPIVSFRISAETKRLLDTLAKKKGTKSNQLAKLIFEEGLPKMICKRGVKICSQQFCGQ